VAQRGTGELRPGSPVEPLFLFVTFVPKLFDLILLERKPFLEELCFTCGDAAKYLWGSQTRPITIPIKTNVITNAKTDNFSLEFLNFRLRLLGCRHVK
jgi:hypothetical protein